MCGLEKTNPKVSHRVIIVETDDEWGYKINDTIYFDGKTEAIDYVVKFNTENASGPDASGFTYAEYTGRYIVKEFK